MAKRSSVNSPNYYFIDRLMETWVAYDKAPGIALGIIDDQDAVRKFLLIRRP